MLPMTVDLDAAPCSNLLGAADQLYIAVAGKAGPLVTPELFTVAGGRIWCLTARTTAKAKILHDGDRVGLVARGADGDVVVGASVRKFDPLDPAALAASSGRVAAAGAGLLRFLAANGYEMAGAASAALMGRLGTPPPARVLLELEAKWVIATSAEGEVLVGDGALPAAATAGPGTPGSDVPAEVTAPALDDGPVVVGWTTPWGPAALPGRWDASRAVAVVSGALVEAVGAPRTSPAAVCSDTWTGPGPLGKQGTMHRGTGWITGPGPGTTIVVDVERVVSWDGVDVSSSEA